MKEAIFHLNEIVSINTKFHENLNNVELNISAEKYLKNLEFLAKSSNIPLLNNLDKKIKIVGVQSYVDSIFFNFISKGIEYRSTDGNSTVTVSNKIT